MVRRLKPFISLIALLLALPCANALAQSAVKPKVAGFGGEPPSAVLFIGNSFFYYNNSLHNHVGRLVRSAQPKVTDRFQSVSATISGSGIDWHDVESYFRPNAVGSYSFDEKNNIVFNKRERIFDAAIIMDCSQCPIHPQLKSVFHEHTKKDADIVRRHGAKPVFFMSWAYSDRPEMTAQLAEAYTTEGNAGSPTPRA